MYKLKGNAHTKPRILMVTVKRCNNYTYREERHKIRLGWGVELFVQSAGELFSFQFALLIKHKITKWELNVGDCTICASNLKHNPGLFTQKYIQNHFQKVSLFPFWVVYISGKECTHIKPILSPPACLLLSENEFHTSGCFSLFKKLIMHFEMISVWRKPKVYSLADPWPAP